MFKKANALPKGKNHVSYHDIFLVFLNAKKKISGPYKKLNCWKIDP